MSTLLFVYNPHSGVQAISRRLREIVDLYTSLGYDVICHPTQRKGECLETVERLANSVARVIVAGGDGTLNEPEDIVALARALLRLESDVIRRYIRQRSRP